METLGVRVEEALKGEEETKEEEEEDRTTWTESRRQALSAFGGRTLCWKAAE